MNFVRDFRECVIGFILVCVIDILMLLCAFLIGADGG